jgi:Meiotically up-regulated gene 113
VTGSNVRGIELGRILTGRLHEPVVYFVRFGTDTVKIGTSTRLLNRVNSLYLRMADVFLVLPGGEAVERAFHERFAAHRIQESNRRELFSLPAVLDELQLMGLYSPAAEPATDPQVREPLPAPHVVTIGEAVAERISGPTVEAVRKALRRSAVRPAPVGRRGNADEYDRVAWCDWEEARRQPRRLTR